MNRQKFLEDGCYAVLEVRWAYPDLPNYPKPKGERVLWSLCIPWKIDYENLVPERYKNIKNYSLYLTIKSTKPRRFFSAKTKARIRKQRLKLRLKKKAPLFLEQFYKNEIEARPRYFDPEHIKAKTDL